MPYDPFSMSTVADAMPSAPYNPYLQDNTAIPNNGAAYYQAQPSYAAPAQPVNILSYYTVSIANSASFNTTSMPPLVLTERT
jgi:hypothetical protein